jgi:hexosaminidase
MHLDCARQFYSIERIKRLMDYMCFFKLNRFHWHLTDNEAWRVELDCYPNLTNQGAFRGYNEKIPPFYGTGYNKSGGYYSRSEIDELTKYANQRNIEIMPEIDLPAHSWTLLEIMPELRDTSSNIISEDVGNYPNNTINPAVEDTQNFLKNILAELSEIFSFNIIHVGVDERPKESWEGSPKVIKYMQDNNISSFDELQDVYMNNIISILKNSNKLTAAWNEAALPPHNDIGSAGSSGKVDKSCIIFAWEHEDVGLMSARKGFKTVLCPGHKTYFDMAHNNSTYERGICWASTIEVKEVFEWKPLQSYNSDEIINILGIQGQLWSETITNEDYFDEMINPRLAALAEIAWCSKAKRSWSQFRSSLLNNMEHLVKMGWKFHTF